MLLTLALTFALPQDLPAAAYYEIRTPQGKPTHIAVFTPVDRLPKPAVSPKHKWEFDWVATGFGETRELDGKHPRVRVFSQEHRSENDLMLPVARMATRLWEHNYWELYLDHRPDYNLGMVDFYLCYGGEAGGEQLIDHATENGFAKTVNTIYIYDLRSFTDPLEKAREIAHEYGHASLPPVGGFKEPEEWANGYLGERLYLRWLRDGIAAKVLWPDDAMGVPLPRLSAWVKENVDPLVAEAATKPPNLQALSAKGQKGMNAYMGLALYASAILPGRTFGRSMLLGSNSAKDYPAAIVAAAAEPLMYTLSVPPNLVGKPIWIPLGSARIQGAKVLARSDDWAKIMPEPSAKVIVRPIHKEGS